jgi:hypothetical protein
MAPSRVVSLVTCILALAAWGCGDGTVGSTRAASTPAPTPDATGDGGDSARPLDAAVPGDPTCSQDHVAWGWVGGELSFESRSASLVACSGMEITVTPMNGPSTVCASVLPAADTTEIAAALRQPEVTLALRSSGTFGCVFELEQQMRLEAAGVTIIVATPRSELEARGVTRGFTCVTDDVPAALEALRITLGRIIDSPTSRACRADGGA